VEIQFTFRHMESTEAIKEHVKKRGERLQKLLHYPVRMNVILGVEKTMHIAEITCHAEHHDFVSQVESKNLYESIDSAIDKLEIQIKKDRDRRKGQQTAHIIARDSSNKLATDVEAEIPHRNKNQ